MADMQRDMALLSCPVAEQLVAGHAQHLARRLCGRRSHRVLLDASLIHHHVLITDSGNLCRQLVPARSDLLVRCRSSSFLTLRMACSSREEATNGPRLPESRCTPWSQQQRNTATLVIQ